MRSWILAGTALLVAAPAWAQDNGQESNPTIVVTGSPLSETARRLKACLDRNCPPTEDIDASLAHSENQFLAGDYKAARATLASSHDRNAKYAKQFPVEVADLDRAYGRLTGMDGYPEWGRILQVGALDTLKGGLAEGDTRILAQRLMTGDEYVQNGRLQAAIDVYRKVEKQARAQGAMRIVGVAMLRPAVLYASLGTNNPNFRDAARSELKRIDRTTEPELASTRGAAQVLRARLAGASGDESEMEAAIAKLARSGFSSPVLVYEKPPFADVQPSTGVINRTLDTNPEWIDIRYRIDASGRVQDIDRLRSSPQITYDWPKYILKSLGKRRYVPLKLPEGSNGLVRIERFTLVFDAESHTGSNMRARSTKPRLVSLDLTPDPPAAPKGG